MPLISDEDAHSGDNTITEILLPQILLGPLKYPIGEAYQLLRESEAREVQSVDRIKISPRVSENCYLLDSNEKIIGNYSPPLTS